MLMFQALKKYAVFKGRARRAEFWWFMLLCFILAILATIIDTLIWGGPAVFYVITILALLLPNIAVVVRRLHDLDKSGWWILLLFVPIVNLLFMIYYAFFRGTQGDNRFGSEPR